MEQNELEAFVISIVIAGLCGAFLYATCRSRMDDVGSREGLAAVPLSWIVLAFFGGLPFVIWEGQVNGRPIGLTDAYFETMSGFTTTGATIVAKIGDLPHGLLFWRSFTHWLGGMGIVVLWVAVLPALGPGTYQLFRSEVPGLTAERMTPRITETAKLLWGIYVGLSVTEALLLWAGPMDLFEALCHTFGTMATGGFSTYDQSIAYYNSWYVDFVIIIFMFLAGCNFALYFLLLKGKFRDVITNQEIRFYVALLAICIVVITTILCTRGIKAPDTAGLTDPERTEVMEHYRQEKAKLRNVPEAFRTAAFQVVSITTTTGYCTADFDVWPDSCRGLLVVLMFFGGCAGSTGGGLKQIRIMLLAKLAVRKLRLAIQPNAVFPVKIGASTMEEHMLDSVLGLFVAAIGLLVIFTLIMLFLGLDLITGFTSVVATMFNIGPGLGGIGATHNYVAIPAAGKWLLSFSMLLGRLEFICVLVLFQPLLYRK